MTDEIIDKLADKILDKLLEKCSKPEWHVRRSDDFVNNLSGIIAFKESEEERMLGEMSKLMTLMVMYEEKGDDDKAKAEGTGTEEEEEEQPSENNLFNK